MAATSIGTTQACAACKYQRRKCSPDCPLAPYFPPEKPKQFFNVHRLYGVSNMLRILKQVEPSKQNDAMKSIVYEANAREKDPVHGCFGVITILQSQVNMLREELELVKNQVHILRQQQQAAYLNSQQQVTSHGSELSQHMTTSVPWLYPYIPASSLLAPDVLEADRLLQIKPSAHGTRLSFDSRLGIFDPRFPIYQVAAKDTYESSAESSIKHPQSREHDELESTASDLFTLTANNQH